MQDTSRCVVHQLWCNNLQSTGRHSIDRGTTTWITNCELRAIAARVGCISGSGTLPPDLPPCALSLTGTAVPKCAGWHQQLARFVSRKPSGHLRPSDSVHSALQPAHYISVQGSAAATGEPAPHPTLPSHLHRVCSPRPPAQHQPDDRTQTHPSDAHTDRLPPSIPPVQR